MLDTSVQKVFKSHEMILAEVESYNSKRIFSVSVHAIELSWVSMAKGGKFPEGTRGEIERERERLERQMRGERNFIRRPDTLNNAAACLQHGRRPGGARLRFRHGKGVLKSKALRRLILYVLT